MILPQDIKQSNVWFYLVLMNYLPAPTHFEEGETSQSSGLNNSFQSSVINNLLGAVQKVKRFGLVGIPYFLKFYLQETPA